MLKPAWYLITETDYWSGLTQSPRLPKAPALMAALDELFGNEAGLNPARTTTAVEVMLRMAEHLSDAVPHAQVAIADVPHAARLLLGLNLLTAHLAQMTARLADHANAITGPDLTNLSDRDRQALARSLATVSRWLEDSAALFKDAHLATAGADRRHP